MISKLDKQIWFIDLIRRRGRIDYNDINTEWLKADHVNPYGVPLNKKTFQNYCRAIYELFGIEISCDRKDGYRYYISEDIDETENTLKKWLLASMSVSNSISESKGLSDRIIFENVPSGGDQLSFIIDAMKESKTISITYQTFWSDKANIYEVDPYGLRVIDRRWYMVGRHEKGPIGIWALDRIMDFDITDKQYEMPADFSLAEYFRNYYGSIVTSDMPLSTIRIKVTGNQEKFIRSLPLHHTQKEIETGDGYSIFEYRLFPTLDFTQRLLTFSGNVEVLSPDFYREDIINTIRSMMQVYEEH